jgi:hypothetical protein
MRWLSFYHNFYLQRFAAYTEIVFLVVALPAEGISAPLLRVAHKCEPLFFVFSGQHDASAFAASCSPSVQLVQHRTG